MGTLNKFIAGFFAVAILLVIFKDGGRGANNILSGIGDLNAKTFRSLSGGF